MPFAGTTCSRRLQQLMGERGEYFVYDNGLRCFTAPCPSYTAISATGEQFAIDEVDLNGPVVDSAGLVVVGTVVHVGEVHALGVMRLQVDAVLEAADVYHLEDTGVRCRTAPCASFSATPALGGEPIPLAGYSLVGEMAMSAPETFAHEVVTTGEFVRGHILHGDWTPGGPGSVLYVTRPVPELSGDLL